MKRAITILLLIILPASCCFLTLFAFSINLPNGTMDARHRWEEAQIDSYRIRYRFGSYTYVGDVIVTVEDGILTQLEQPTEFNFLWHPDVGDSTTQVIDKVPSWYTHRFGFAEVLPPDLSHYSVPELFDYWIRVENKENKPLIQLCSLDSRYEVEFNANLGYIERLTSTNCGNYDYGLGFLCPNLSHCQKGVQVIEFEVIDTGD